MNLKSLSAALAVCAVASVPALCKADTSVGVGAFAPNGESTTSAVLLTTTLPAVSPIAQASLIVPHNGRYAVTAETRTSGLQHFGVGTGIARLHGTSSTGMIFTGFAATPIAPNTALAARYYTGLNGSVGSSAFVGLQFRL